jgi:hypothetical protein
MYMNIGHKFAVVSVGGKEVLAMDKFFFKGKFQLDESINR